MKAEKEREYLHIRLGKEQAEKIRKIARKTRRSLNTETELAVEQYKPRLCYVDNGK